MKILGITNLVMLNTKDIGILMYEFDKVKREDVFEDCSFLSKCFDVDLYILESSKNSYHVISFDIMTLNEISKIQGWFSLETDYLNIGELACNFYNILRLGNKGNKDSPKFLKVFYSKNDKRMKSLGHYQIYRRFCNIPNIPEEKEKLFIKTEIDLIMYNSHKTQKVVKTKWI